jgi:hypothetical protein
MRKEREMKVICEECGRELIKEPIISDVNPVIETKKEILDWWNSLDGNNKNTENWQNDYEDFWKRVSGNLAITETCKGTGDKQRHKIIIMSARWKYPLRLYFYNLQCYRIVDY